MKPYNWLNNFYNVYMAAIVGIDNKCGVKYHHRNQSNKSKLSLYKQLL